MVTKSSASSKSSAKKIEKRPAKDLFLDRELSILEFNRRVLSQAEDPNVPLMERLNFLCIVTNNTDEFFEVRLAGLLANRYGQADDLHAVMSKSLLEISESCHKLVSKQYEILHSQIIPALEEKGYLLLSSANRTEEQNAWVKSFFDAYVRPVLTPIVLTPTHPFPQVANKSLYFVASLAGKDAFGRQSSIAIVRSPLSLPAIVPIPEELCEEGKTCFCFMSSIIQAHFQELFPQREVLSVSQFRVTRDNDLWVDEEEVKNLREALQLELKSRSFGKAIRLEVAQKCPEEVAELLLKQFGLEKDRLYRINGPVNIMRLNELRKYIKNPSLYYEPFVPGNVSFKNKGDIFSTLKRRDILLHHPFQSFQMVEDFIQTAAHDPDVLIIKQTIYRVGSNSKIIKSLIEAAQNGKEVTAIVEIKARFDEENNIDLAGQLEQAGVQVIYGVMGLKIHAKLSLVIRREKDSLRYYAHLGTGNYNPSTARFYTDFGLLTARPEIAQEVNEVFIHITGLTKSKQLHNLWQGPFSLHSGIIRAIRNEMRIAREGRPAHIVAKVNSLVDQSVIRALYEASNAGVKIDLIVRGACALKPCVPGLSENIKVHSIVGRFLEHSRIYYFLNDRKHDVYLSSADWMARNLFRRIEVAFPVLEKSLKKRVIEEGLRPYLKDNTNSWKLEPDGKYRRRWTRNKKSKFSAHQYLMDKLGKKN